MDTKDTSKLLLEKYLGDRLSQVIRSEGSKFVLVTSARKYVGKSLFIDLIRNYMLKKWPDMYVFLPVDQLGSKEPREFEHRRVIIDGFALNEGGESLDLPQIWQEAIDTAVLVVMGRETTQIDIKEAITRLQAMDIRPIGVVFNSLLCPSWSATWSRLRFFGRKSKGGMDRRVRMNARQEKDQAMGYLKLEGLMPKNDNEQCNEPDEKN